MLRFLFKKQKVLVTLLTEYLQSIAVAQENFLQAMQTYLQTGICCQEFEFMAIETHKAESRGDDIHQKIIMLLFEKALIPEFRGDILALLESLDDVPDQFDRVLSSIETQKIVLHELVKPDFSELVNVSVEICTVMQDAARSLIRPDKGKDAGKFLFRADQLESQGDHIEKRMLTHIFSSDLDPLQKILLRDLVRTTGGIADHAVHACRDINLITVKRLV